MATWKETYVSLAVAFDATVSDAVLDYVHLREARLAIVDLTTIDDGSQSGYGTEAAVAFLETIDVLVRQAESYFDYDLWRLVFVKDVNKFTIKHFGDLDDFVNGLDWPDLCAPVYWAALSEDSGTDTSNWIVCS
jgi:hypothetical protein